MGKCKYGKIGEKYGRLTIIGEAEPYISPKGQKNRIVVCQCNCGSDPINVYLSSLRKGATKSCGCYKKEVKRKHNKFDINYDTGIVTGYTCKGEKFYLDVEDLSKVKKCCWSISVEGYVVAKYENKALRMHRFITDCPDDKVVDHIDHCKTNNCKSNLRICDKSDNSKNISVAKNNTSGITGVTWHKGLNKWCARIGVNGKMMNLGYFNDKEEAIEMRYEAELKYFGKYSINYEKLTQKESTQSQQNT